MTPERLRECLAALNWSTAALAAMAQISPVTARRWLNGQREVPSKVAAAMETMVAAATALCSGGRQTSQATSHTDGCPMTTLNEFDRQFLADILRRDGVAAVLSELAWLQAEADLPKPLAEPAHTSKLDMR
jgi:transcriptional regulator with XRE-family HTH domain